MKRSSHMSIDEMMIPYYGKHGDKQFIRGKPIRFGFKAWSLCSSDGYSQHIEPYCGASTMLETFGMGQGPDVVAGLCKAGGVIPGTRVFFDNLFTSMNLLNYLSDRGIGGTGTVRQNRVFGMPNPDQKQFSKKERGDSVSFFAQDVAIVTWLDNKAVTVASNVHGHQATGLVKRYSKVRVFKQYKLAL